MRPLRTLDTAALVLFATYAGNSQAFTLQQASANKPSSFSVPRYLGFAITQRALRNVWVSGTPARIRAVLRAGPQSGPLVWQLREFYRTGLEPEAEVDLLEFIAARAASAGALRILLRARQDSGIVQQACRAGYVPYKVENAYRLPASKSPADGSISLLAGRLGMRRRVSRDEHGLFRLYCSVTPVEVRTHSGMTIDEWRDGTERAGRHAEEWVWEEDGHVSAWLRTSVTSAGRYLEATVDDTFPHGMPALVECGVAGAGQAGVTALVPEYQDSLRTALELKGFEPQGAFEVLARPLAIRVKRPAGAVAAAG